jgi:uncharacterized membrane protein
MRDNNNLKFTYSILYAAGAASCLLIFLFSFIPSVAVLFFALTVKSKLPDEETPPQGLKIMIISSIAHIISSVLFLFPVMFSMLFPDSIRFFLLFCGIGFHFLFNIIILIFYITGLVFVKKEYYNID